MEENTTQLPQITNQKPLYTNDREPDEMEKLIKEIEKEQQQ